MSQRIVGLDLGTSAIRAVELTLGEGARPVLEAFGQVGLPPGAIVDGEIRDRDGIVAALERLWRDGGFKSKSVVVGIAGLRAITREIDMPTLPDNELDNAVRFQADEVVPFPMERTSISAKVIARYTDQSGEPTLRVLIAAAHRDLIDGVVAVVTSAGLEPVGIDLNTAALVRALHDPALADEPEAIVSVGAGLTLVVVHQAGVLQFVRTIDLGGESMTRAIAASLDLPMTDAEDIKRRLGQPGPSDPRAHSTVAKAVDELVGEIQNSVRFFASLPGRSAVSRVLVTGGGALTFGFLPKLEHRLDQPVEAASPLLVIDTSRLPMTDEEAESINPTLAVPVGLAMPDPSGRPFNLLPPEVMKQADERKVRKTLATVGVGALVLIAALSAWRVVSVNHAKQQVAVLTASITQIQTVQIPKYDKAVMLKNQVASQEAQARPAIASELDWLVVLNQISQYQPTNAVVGSLNLTASPPPAPAPTIKGQKAAAIVPNTSPLADVGSITATVNVPNLPAVTTWGESMTQAPGLSNVIPTGTLSNSASGVTFAASMQINGNAHTQRLAEFSGELP